MKKPGGSGTGGGPKGQNFTPVTLKMLEDSPVGPEDNLEVDGVSVSEIIVVGRLICRTEE